MKIISIDASNFLSFGEKKIEISNNSNNENQSGKPLLELNRNRVSVLVGPNGSGKTNIFRLLEFVKKVFINGGASPRDIKQYIRNGQNGFDISVSLALDEHDRNLLNNYLILLLLLQISQKPIQQNISNQSNSENDTKNKQSDFDESDRKKMYEFLLKKDYELIGNEDLEITFNINAAKLINPDLKIIYKFNKHNQVFYQKFHNTYLTRDHSREIFNFDVSRQLSDLIIEEAKQRNYAELRPLADIICDHKECNAIYLGYSFDNLNYIIENDIKNKVDEPCRKQLVSIYDKFRDSLSSMKYDMITRSFITLDTFWAYLYRSCVVPLANPREPLKGSFKLYHSESRNVKETTSFSNKNIAGQIPDMMNQMGREGEDTLKPIRALEGEELTKRLFEIAHSENENEYKVWLKLQDSMCELLHIKPRLVLENNTVKIIFEEFQDNCGKDQGKKQVGFEFAPAAAIELLTVLASVAVANEKVLLLDEPAVNLHPPFQRKLYDYIKDIAETNNAQVIMITHSPHMINPFDLKKVWRMYLENGTSKIINVGEKTEGNEKWFVRQAKLLASLFADAVVLAEGEGEEAALEVWLGNSKKILEKGKYVVIFSVGSKDSLKPYATMLKSLNVDCFIFCDENTYKTKVKNVENKTEKNEENKKDILSELDEQGRVFWAGKYGKKQSQADNTQNEVIYHDIACYLYECYSNYEKIQDDYIKQFGEKNCEFIDHKKCKNLNEKERVCKDPYIILAVATNNKNEPPREVEELIEALVDREKKQAN